MSEFVETYVKEKISEWTREVHTSLLNCNFTGTFSLHYFHTRFGEQVDFPLKNQP